jgi:trans-aconitate 2-methyltransferase
MFKHVCLLLCLFATSATQAFDSSTSRAFFKEIPLDGEERVLHFGCGRGTITAEIAQRVPEGFVLGVDLCHEAVAAAKATYDLDLFANLGFQAVNAQALSFSTQFDLIACCDTLHEVPDSAQAIKQMARSLRPGGTLCALVRTKGMVEEAIEATIATVDWTSLFRGYHRNQLFDFLGADALLTALRGAGLYCQTFEERCQRLVFSSPQEFRKWLSGQIPELFILPKEEQTHFIYEVGENLLALHREIQDPTGQISLPLQGWKVEATKRSLSIS